MSGTRDRELDDETSPHHPAPEPPLSTAGLDVGDKTIGVAITDDLNITAQGVGVVRRKGDKHDFPALDAMLKERDISLFVVGWPLNMDGTEGFRALKTRRFAKRLEERLNRPV